MRYAVVFFILLSGIACSKPSGTPAVQTPPKDTTVVAQPQDTTAAPPKDTTATSITFKTMVVNSGLIVFLDSSTSRRTFIDYQDGADNAKLDNYVNTFEVAQLSSYNEGDISVSSDPNTPGDQIVTFSTFSTRDAYKETAPVSDTAKFFNLRVRQSNVITIIFPNQTSVIRYRNLPHAVTAADVKAVNNQTIYIEHLYYQQ